MEQCPWTDFRTIFISVDFLNFSSSARRLLHYYNNKFIVNQQEYFQEIVILFLCNVDYLKYQHLLYRVSNQA